MHLELDARQFRLAENSNIHDGTLDDLAKCITAQIPVHIIDIDDRLTSEKGSAKTLLGFLLIFASGNDRARLT